MKHFNLLSILLLYKYMFTINITKYIPMLDFIINVLTFLSNITIIACIIQCIN